MSRSTTRAVDGTARPGVAALTGLRSSPAALLALVPAAALVPWTVRLAGALPTSYLVSNWDVTWVGFDLALLVALTSTGLAGWRRHPLAQPMAVLTATLLGCDAWFDVTTAATAGDRVLGVLLAALVELPLAAALLLTTFGSTEPRAAVSRGRSSRGTVAQAMPGGSPAEAGSPGAGPPGAGPLRSLPDAGKAADRMPATIRRTVPPSGVGPVRSANSR